jgi:hypothetical protein
MPTDKTEKSLPTLFSDLTRETVELIRQEIALARAEMSQKISTAEKALVAIAIGAAIMLAGVLILLQALVNGVAMLLPPDLAPWLAPLIVGAAIAIIGYAMLKSGRAHLQPENLTPRRTMESLRRDTAVVQERAR